MLTHLIILVVWTSIAYSRCATVMYFNWNKQGGCVTLMWLRSTFLLDLEKKVNLIYVHWTTHLLWYERNSHILTANTVKMETLRPSEDLELFIVPIGLCCGGTFGWGMGLFLKMRSKTLSRWWRGVATSVECCSVGLGDSSFLGNKPCNMHSNNITYVQIKCIHMFSTECQMEGTVWGYWHSFVDPPVHTYTARVHNLNQACMWFVRWMNEWMSIYEWMNEWVNAWS